MSYYAKKFDHLLDIKNFSEQAMKNHLALYQGYITNTNKLDEVLKSMLGSEKISSPEFSEIKRRYGWEANGIRLHELYFENITNNPKPLENDSVFALKVKQCFGTIENWEKDFKATAVMRGIGWAITCYDSINDQIINAWINEHNSGYIAGAISLLVLDMFEHAYMLDYGVKKTDYIDNFIKIVDWNAVNSRININLLC